MARAFYNLGMIASDGASWPEGFTGPTITTSAGVPRLQRVELDIENGIVGMMPQVRAYNDSDNTPSSNYTLLWLPTLGEAISHGMLRFLSSYTGAGTFRSGVGIMLANSQTPATNDLEIGLGNNGAPQDNLYVLDAVSKSELTSTVDVTTLYEQAVYEHYLRFTWTGSTIQARVWRADATEPSTWQINYSHVTRTFNEMAIVIAQNSSYNIYTHCAVAGSGETLPYQHTRGPMYIQGTVSYQAEYTYEWPYQVVDVATGARLQTATTVSGGLAGLSLPYVAADRRVMIESPYATSTVTGSGVNTIRGY